MIQSPTGEVVAWGAPASGALVAAFCGDELFAPRGEECASAGSLRALRKVRFRGTAAHAFTIIELLIVMAIIMVLAGLILGTSGYVQKKAARSRAEAEIAAMSAALESYKADNGAYPSSADTTQLNPTTNGNESSYRSASLYLYQALSGNDPATGTNQKSYFTFKPQMLGYDRDAQGQQTTTVLYLKDPFGNSYGYSTMKANSPTGSGGYNPSFDLWSIGTNDPPSSSNGQTNQSQWVKNW